MSTHEDSNQSPEFEKWNVDTKYKTCQYLKSVNNDSNLENQSNNTLRKKCRYTRD